MDTNRQLVQQYLSSRHGSNAWVLRDDVVDAWRRGAQLDVRPMTAEYSPALTCNADCYACPFRRSRLQLHDEVLHDGWVVEDDIHSSTGETAKRIVDAAYDGGVRGFLLTGGGEPTVWRPLPDLLRYAGDRGITNGLYTNGFILGRDADYARRLLEPERSLAFVRVSINAVTPRIVSLHWGVDASEVAQQLTGLARLLEARNDLAPAYGARPIPSIQVSTIVDRNNVADLLSICETVAEIFKQHRRVEGSEDRVIVRPLTYHGRKRYSSHDHPDWVIERIIEVCGRNGEGQRLLSNAGLDTFLGFGLEAIENGMMPDYSSIIDDVYAKRDVSLATGLFLIVGPAGSVHVSTEHNCDPAWSLGDLRTQTVEEIYRSERRRALLDELNASRWGPEVAQATSRTARLDRIAVAIRERLLSDDDVRTIADAATTSHCLILD